MNVVVDGIIYQQRSMGGILRIYNEILPRMCEIDESINITLLTHEQPKQALPKHSRITHRALSKMEGYFPRGVGWQPSLIIGRRIMYRLWTGFGKGKIWHSTYYTLPGKWRGMQVITVADMIHERFANLLNEPGHEWFREQKRNCVLAADAVLCISETTRQEVQVFYGIDIGKIRVIPLAYSDVFKPLASADYTLLSPTGKPFLLYVGSRALYKNFNGLLSAYSNWVDRKEVDLVVVGENWTAVEDQYLVKLGIRDRVHLIEHVDDVRLCHLYNQATAFVYPSFYEGFGIPLLEAMACGCPVVASRIPSTIEVAGECPIFFEPTQGESLLAALETALLERRDSERVEEGFKQVKRYSWDKTAMQILDVYHELWRKMGTNDGV